MIVVTKYYPIPIPGQDLVGPFETYNQAEKWARKWCTPRHKSEEALLKYAIGGPIWTIDSAEQADYTPIEIETWIRTGKPPKEV